MCGYNCSFIIEKWPFVECMTATGMANYLSIFENRNDCKYLFQQNTVPAKILYHCKWPPEIMTVPLKYKAASALLKLQYAEIFVKYIVYTQFMAASALLK